MAKEDLLKTLPSSIEDRKRLSRIVQEGVDAMTEMRDASESLKNILKITKEDMGIDPQYLNTLITFEYDRQKAAEKKRAAFEAKVELLAELDILMLRGGEQVQTEEDDE